MKNGLIGIIIGVLCAIVIIGTIAVPYINNVTAETLTIENEGSYFAEPDGNDHTLVFKNGYVTVDGVDVDYPEGFGTGGGRNATVVIGDDWMLRLDSGLLRLAVVGPDNAWVVLGNLNTDTVTVSISGSTLTYTYNNAEYTRDNTQYYLSDSGDMVMCYNPYILDDSLLIGGIRASTSVGDVFEIVTGDIADGFTAVSCRVLTTSTPSTGDVTSSEFTINTSSIVTNLLKLDSIVQEATLYTSDVATITITYLLAPAEIVYDNPEYIGDSSVLMGIIPVIMIIAILASFIYAALRNRDY